MSPKPDADDPRIGAPSPADNPTTPQRPAVARTPGAPAGGTGAIRPSDPRPGDPRREDAPGRPAGRDGAAGPPPAQVSPGRTVSGGTWVGVILGAVVLIFLLVFILQNLQPAQVSFLGLQGSLPLGVWLLFAAIAGVLLLAVPGLGRLLQWRRAGKAARSTGASRRPPGGRGRR